MPRKSNIKFGTKELEKKFGPLTLGDFLNNYRITAGITQKDFAKTLKISPYQLSNFENGKRLPDIKRVVSFAKILKDSELFFVQLLLQDSLRRAGLKYRITLTKR